MDIMSIIWSFCTSDEGRNVIAGVLAGLWMVSEALASIPSIKANSVFQLVYNALTRVKAQVTPHA